MANKKNNRPELLNTLKVPLVTQESKILDMAALNLCIWQYVWQTDPGMTKSFRKQGFSGTAVDPQQQKKMATAIFGPMGIGWGTRNETYDYFGERENMGCGYRADLFFCVPENPIFGRFAGMEGSFGIASDVWLFIYSEKYNKWLRKDDHRKVARTDAITKGLSELGFNSDIFEGKMDDSKYKKDMGDFFGKLYSAVPMEEPPAPTQRRTPSTPPAKKRPVFAYSGKNKEHVMGYFEKGELPAAVIDRLDKANFVVSDEDKERIKADYETWKKSNNGQ